MKLSSVRARSVAVCLLGALVLATAFPASAQTNYYAPNGTEYLVVGSLPGDQMFPDAAISPTNGIVVWQDNATDGDGWGISARRLDGTLSGALSAFRVNVNGAGNQENPRVALLKSGGAAIVWQGGVAGKQHIYARFLTVSNTFLTTNDILINTYTNTFQLHPALTVLTNGNLAVVWASYNQVNSNSMQDVYCQMLSTNGSKIGTNFLVNQFTSFNQRGPAVAALHNGGFVVTWVSEQERSTAPNWGSNTVFTSASGLPSASVDIYGRLYNSAGAAVSGEFLVNNDSNVAADPSVAAALDGSFMVAWCEKDPAMPTNGWDIYARPFSGTGVAGGVTLVNTHIYGDQYAPRIKSIGDDYLVIWTSLGQDGSREGVYGQFLHNNGAAVSGEFRINTTTWGQQMQPCIASDGASQFLVSWTSFAGASYGYDLFAQRYLNVSSLLLPMSAPYVWAPFVVSNNVYQPQLVVSWPPLLGLSVANYEVYANGAGAPTSVVTNNSWTMTAANGLATSTAASFQVDYVLTDGRRSPISPPASGTTWGGLNWGGIPFEWMEAYYGTDLSTWPAAKSTVAPNMTLAQVFLSGGNPTDPGTWLHQQVVKTSEGMFLNWNTTPGATYQVQSTADFHNWTNVGAPRFAAGSSDSIYVGGAGASYYRVLLQR